MGQLARQRCLRTRPSLRIHLAGQRSIFSNAPNLCCSAIAAVVRSPSRYCPFRSRTEIKTGELLREMKERGERAKAGDNQHGSSGAQLPPLSDLGVSKTQSSRHVCSRMVTTADPQPGRDARRVGAHRHTLPITKGLPEAAAETFNRETANDEDRVDYRAHYNRPLNCLADRFRIGGVVLVALGVGLCFRTSVEKSASCRRAEKCKRLATLFWLNTPSPMPDSGFWPLMRCSCPSNPPPPPRR